jgi:hypothetical protein
VWLSQQPAKVGPVVFLCVFLFLRIERWLIQLGRLLESSIGQTEAMKREKCPIEGLYRPNGRREERKVSDRRALSDKRKARRKESVR